MCGAACVFCICPGLWCTVGLWCLTAGLACAPLCPPPCTNYLAVQVRMDEGSVSVCAACTSITQSLDTFLYCQHAHCGTSHACAPDLAACASAWQHTVQACAARMPACAQVFAGSLTEHALRRAYTGQHACHAEHLPGSRPALLCSLHALS